MPGEENVHREAAPGEHQPQVAVQPDKDDLLREAIAALTLQMRNQNQNQNQEPPAWKVTKNLRVEAFDRTKHDAQTWFEHFATAIRAQNIADNHVWACFTQNIIDHRALTWASEQPTETKATLKDIRKAFLDEYGQSRREQERARYELSMTKQARDEHPRDYCRRVTQDYRRLHAIKPGKALSSEQEVTVVTIIRQGLQPVIAEAVWNARVDSLAEVTKVAGECADRGLPGHNIDETISMVAAKIRDELRPMMTNQAANMVGAVEPTTNMTPGANTPRGEGNHGLNISGGVGVSESRGQASGRGQGRRNNGPFKGRCYICNTAGHRAATCSQRIQNSQAKCFICGGAGHTHQVCPGNPNATSQGAGVAHVGSQSSAPCQMCGGIGHTAPKCGNNK